MDGSRTTAASVSTRSPPEGAEVNPPSPHPSDGYLNKRPHPQNWAWPGQHAARTVGITARGQERPLALRHGGGARALEADRGGERAGGRPAAGRPPGGSDELGSLSRRIAHSGRDGAQPHHDHAGPHFDPEADGHAVGDVVGVRIGRGDPGGHLERAVHPGQVPGCRRHGAQRHGEGPRGPGAVHPAPGRRRSGRAPGPRRGSLRAHGSRSPPRRTGPLAGCHLLGVAVVEDPGEAGPVQVRQQAHAGLLPDPVLHAEVRSCRWGTLVLAPGRS